VGGGVFLRAVGIVDGTAVPQIVGKGARNEGILSRPLPAHLPGILVVLLLSWAGNRLSWGVAAANLTLLPLNYCDFLNVPPLIVPTWSLACEAHFYLLVPLLVLCSTKILRAMLCASLGFFAITPFLPHSDFWAYFALPGIFFAFLSGILINRKDFAFLKIIWAAVLVLLVAFALTKVFHTGLRTGIHINITIGYMTAIIATTWLVKFPPDVKWDKVLGLFSYPLFLCHGLAEEFAGRHWHIWNPIASLGFSILFAGILILIVEIPFDRVRYRLRARV
jgi:peptidoglycan/LPS O-acetylase OafA/YrhL